MHTYCMEGGFLFDWWHLIVSSPEIYWLIAVAMNLNFAATIFRKFGEKKKSEVNDETSTITRKMLDNLDKLKKIIFNKIKKDQTRHRRGNFY